MTYNQITTTVFVCTVIRKRLTQLNCHVGPKVIIPDFVYWWWQSIWRYLVL